jgi:hypothetical protein
VDLAAVGPGCSVTVAMAVAKRGKIAAMEGKRAALGVVSLI